MYCGVHIEQIIEHVVKEQILNEIYQCIKLKFQDDYYRHCNEDNLQTLIFPHLMTLKSRGRSCWLYCTRLYNLDYCIIIEKFVKPGYPYPKMMIGNFSFDFSIYTNTLFECELSKLTHRENDWVMLVQDILMYENASLRGTEPIERYNLLHHIFETKFTENLINQPCTLQVKAIFNLKQGNEIKKLAREVPYTIAGICFIPMDIRFQPLVWDDVEQRLQHKQSSSSFHRHPVSQQSRSRSHPNQEQSGEETLLTTDTITDINLEQLHEPQSIPPPLSSSSTTDPEQGPEQGEEDIMSEEEEEEHDLAMDPVVMEDIIFPIRKTTMPNVYHVIKKTGEISILHIPNLETSKRLKLLFMEIDQLNLPCLFNKEFEKWQLNI